MLGEESENTRMLKEIRDLLRNLLELRARSKMGRVNAAPEPGE